MFDEDAIIRYQEGVAELQRRKKEQIKVAEIRKKLHLKSIESCFEAEELAARQDYESEKALLFDTLKEDLEKKIDIAENEYYDHKEKNKLLQLRPVVGRNCKSKYKKSLCKPTRNRPMDVRGGPYVVYMLKDEEIEEDLKIIRKALRKRELSPVCCKETFNEFSNQQMSEKEEVDYSFESNMLGGSVVKESVSKAKKFEKLKVSSSETFSIDDSNCISHSEIPNKIKYDSGSVENLDCTCSAIDLSHKKLDFKSKVTPLSLINEHVPNNKTQSPTDVSFQANDSNFIVTSDMKYEVPNILELKQSRQLNGPQVDSGGIHSPIKLSHNKLNFQSKAVNRSSAFNENFSFSKPEIPLGVAFSANDSSFIGSFGIYTNAEHKYGASLNCPQMDSFGIESPINLSCSDINISYEKPSTILTNLSGVNCPNTIENELIVSDLPSGFVKYCTSMNSIPEGNLENYQIQKNLSSWTSSVSSIAPSCTVSYSRNSDYPSINPVPVCLECSCNNVTASEVICSSDSQPIPEENRSIEPTGETFVSYISETSREIVYYTENPISTVNGLCSSLSFTKTMHFINHQTEAELMFISDCEQITVETSRSPQNSPASEALDNLGTDETGDVSRDSLMGLSGTKNIQENCR